jgi:PAS domain S-box-containing protein
MLKSLVPATSASPFATAVAAILAACRSLIMRHIWIIGALLATLTLAGATATLWNMRSQAIEGAAVDTRNLGTILGEQTTRYVQVIDLLLLEVRSRSRDLEIRTPAELRDLLGDEATHLVLEERLKSLPQAHAISVFDANGDLVTTSRRVAPTAGINVADRDYFRYVRSHGDDDLFVSPPHISRGSGTRTIFLARRISAADGTFLGAAVSAVDVSYLLGFYETISHQRHFEVTLLRNDGMVLARYPALEITGQSIPRQSPWYGRVAAGGGNYRSPGYLTGVASIVSVTPLRAYPLVVDVVLHECDVLAPWWRQAAFILAGAIVLAGAFVALFWLIARQMRRQTRYNAALSRTADALRASEGRLRDFAELASDWFWEQDAALRFTEVGIRSPALECDDQSHIGKHRWDISTRDGDPERWEKHRHVLLARRPFHDFRYDRIGADGCIHHVSISGVPVHDGSGTFVGYRGIGRDLTRQIEAEQELYRAKERAERAEELLQDAIDSIAEGFVIFDSEMRLVTCNESYRKLFSVIGVELVPGLGFADMVRQGLLRGAFTEAIGREEQWVEKAVRSAREGTSEIELMMKDGTCVLVNNRRMRNGGTAGLRIDITALKQAQIALRESEARLDRAQEIAGIGSWELDLATDQYTWSRHLYSILGLPPQYQPTRANLESSAHPDDHPAVAAWLAALQASQPRDPIDFRVMRPDGQVRVLRAEGRPVTNADGVTVRVIGTMQDITERRLIERQLAQAQKMEAIGTLTGGMAHDFNNVLGVIVGNLDLLKRRVGTDDMASELCAEALDAATRAGDLIRRLLAFARRQSLRPERTDVNLLVSDTARLLGRTLGEDIAVTLELDPVLWPVMADPAQLEAALVNLASNARDAMPKGGHLSITTTNIHLDASYTALHPDVAAGDYALIKITDTGSGIPPELIARIFEPFFTTKEPGKGTGLGLSMVYGFVKQSNGHMTVYSEPGLGTTFRLYLPRGDAGKPVLASAPVAAAVTGGHETVLLVEDNEQLRHTASRQLTQLGYRVLQAERADAAFAILGKADSIDLLFTDVVMPGPTDGLDLAHRATWLRPGLKVLLTSGFPDLRGGDRRLAEVPFPLLHKPYRRDELARAVRDALDQPVDPGVAAMPAAADAEQDTHDGDRVVISEQV